MGTDKEIRKAYETLLDAIHYKRKVRKDLGYQIPREHTIMIRRLQAIGVYLDIVR